MRRIQISDGEHYHVFNRGVGKQVIFNDLGDYTRFLFLILYFQFDGKVDHLTRAVRIFSRSFGQPGQNRVLARYESGADKRNVEVVSFCIMANHFHLILKETGEEGKGISAYMQRILNAYGKYYNTKYNKSGHVFQGPYRAVRVEDDTQLMHLSAYVHLNPRELSGWKGREKSYPWSSYQDYVAENRWGKLLENEIIMSRFAQYQEYENFVSTSLAKLSDAEREQLLKASQAL